MECNASILPLLIWTQFNVVILKKYVPRKLRDRKKNEFMKLEHCSMSMAAYEAKFHALSRYSTQLIATEKERILFFNKDWILSYNCYLFTWLLWERDSMKWFIISRWWKGWSKKHKVSLCLRGKRIQEILKEHILENSVDLHMRPTHFCLSWPSLLLTIWGNFIIIFKLVRVLGMRRDAD